MDICPVGINGLRADQIAEQAVRAAGHVVMKRVYETTPQTKTNIDVISHKNRVEIVTDVDEAAEKAIIALIKAEFPDHLLLAEESGLMGKEPANDGVYKWIIDPLDGTRNFASRIPHFAINVALTMGNQILLGVTFDPVRNELFRAVLGQGAYLNDKPLQVSSKTDLKQSVIGADLGYSDDKARRVLKLLAHVCTDLAATRIMGSGALGLAYVASGRIDLYTHLNLLPWDVAPGILLVNEAGGITSNVEGGMGTIYEPTIVAGNRAIHSQFMGLTSNKDWNTPTELFQ